MAAGREAQGRRPAQVAVAPKNENAHRSRQGNGRGRHSIRADEGLAARNGGRSGLAALVAILLLGLGLRADEAWDGRAPVYDAQGYAAIAANLERGEGFTLGGAGDPAGEQLLPRPAAARAAGSTR